MSKKILVLALDKKKFNLWPVKRDEKSLILLYKAAFKVFIENYFIPLEHHLFASIRDCHASALVKLPRRETSGYTRTHLDLDSLSLSVMLFFRKRADPFLVLTKTFLTP